MIRIQKAPVTSYIVTGFKDKGVYFRKCFSSIIEAKKNAAVCIQRGFRNVSVALIMYEEVIDDDE